MSLRTMKLQTLGLVICGSAILLMLISFLGLPDDRSSGEYIHRPMLSTMTPQNSKDGLTCEHTNQGKFVVVDDKGMVCPREEINSFGCCNSTTTDRIAYSCETCDEKSYCCSVYEYCVSCCLNPIDNQFLEKRKDASFRKTLPKAQMWLWALDDNFEFCTAQCRTSSRTVIHQNVFKSPLKHCYGPTGPSLTNTYADRRERGTDSDEGAKTKAARDVVHHDDIDQKGSESVLEGLAEEKGSDDAEPRVTVDAANTSDEGQAASDVTDSAESDSASDEVLDQIDAAVQTSEKQDASASDAKSTEMEMILERLKRVEEEKKALEEENKRLKDRNFGETDARATDESVTATLRTDETVTATTRSDEDVTAAVRSAEPVTLAALSHDMEHQHAYDQSVRHGSAKLSPAVSSKFIRFSYYMMYIATAFSIWLSYYWDLA